LKTLGSWTKKRNAKGENRLHIAAMRGDLSLVKTLISSGICVNEKDNAGWTAIHEASVRGFTEVMSELLEAGADINCRGLDGILPIHDAVSANSLEAVRILLQHGANPHERDDFGKNALDKACDDEMRELLKSYGAIDSGHSVETVRVASKFIFTVQTLGLYCSCKESDRLRMLRICRSDAAIQDTVQKQEELLLLELRSSKDAEAYIQKLSQIQDALNEVLSKQKMERDTLAKKYRASVESFKKGALREQLVKLASRQKSLLNVAQNQKKLVQKIQNYRKEKQVFATHSKKQISHTPICYGNSKEQDLTTDKVTCPDVVTFSTGPGARMPNGNRVEADLSLEKRFSAQECSQHPNSCLAERGANKEAIRSKEVSDHGFASGNRVRGYPVNILSKVTNVVEVGTLPSVAAAETNRLQQRVIDCAAAADPGNKSPNPTAVANTLSISEAQSAVVSNSICQASSGCARVPPAADPRRDGNKKDTSQQQQVFASSVDSFNANLVLTSLVSNTDYPINLSQKSSQSSSSQQCEQKQLRCRGNKKKLQLIDLLQLGRIKPGENVLEFKLQEFSYKATLLENGKIKISNRILQNPVQWVKELLGNDISVTWKYVWNKVGLILMLKIVIKNRKKILTNVYAKNCFPLFQYKISNHLLSFSIGSPVRFNSLENLMHFLLFNEMVIVHKDEFLPCHIMEKHWNFYKECEDFGF
uniref:RAMA domain-containing protein n=1 Tax=Nothoprocta perdicaria TaxID=30464 RepID=A0A8C7A3T3_NOTPE